MKLKFYDYIKSYSSYENDINGDYDYEIKTDYNNQLNGFYKEKEKEERKKKKLG
jgi:hypothetical protein